MRTVFVALLVASALVFAPTVTAQTLSLDLEAGFQWVDITGNEDMYKTQVNQDDGFVLRDFSLQYLDPESDGFIDRLRIDAAGFGGEPSGRFRMEAGLGSTYRVRLGYRQANHFSALAGFANPNADDGIVPGQHTWDRDREMFDFEIEFFPSASITPIVGYRWNRIEGPRTTTYHFGQDEFQLDSRLEETENELYFGAAFRFGDFAGSLIQGWRDFEGTETASLSAGAELGNNLRPILGRDIEAESIDRTTRIDEASTPVTTFHIAGQVTDMMALKASYIRADSEIDTLSRESATGSFASYRISRFFEGFDQSVSTRTESPSWRGDLDLAFDLSDIVTFDLGFEVRDVSMDGWGLIASTFTDTATFGGLDADDVEDLIAITNSGSRNDETFDARLNLDFDGPVMLWAEASTTATDLDLVQDAAEIVIAGHQDGGFNRSTTSIEMGAAIDFGDARVSVDVRNRRADAVIMRTDFTGQTRFRVRLDLPFADVFDIRALYEDVDSENIDEGVGFSSDSEHMSVDLGLTPGDVVAFHVIWDTFESKSMVSVRRPHDFGIEPSLYAEDATMIEGLVDVDLGSFGLHAGVSNFENDGSFEIDLERAYARLWYAFSDRLSAALEYETYDYAESAFSVADFDSERVGLFFRIRR